MQISGLLNFCVCVCVCGSCKQIAGLRDTTQALQSNLKSHKSENTQLQERLKALERSLADAQVTGTGSGTTPHTVVLNQHVSIKSVKNKYHGLHVKLNSVRL